MTIQLFDAAITQYAGRMSTHLGEVLDALERETYMKVMQPVMLSGPGQGAFLQMLSKLLRPRRILEIGTFTGYATICLAQGLADEGCLHTIEIDEEKGDIIERYIRAAGLESKVQLHFGPAADIIPRLDETWDMVFIDADKPAYGTYFDLLIDRMLPGGIILADNVLFEGKVLLPEERQGKNEKAMHAFNQKIRQDKRVEVMLLPIRDGLSLIRKL